MPLLRLSTSKNDFDIDSLSKKLSQEISALTGKPERYVMIIIEGSKDIFFDSTNEPSAFIEIKSIGSLNPTLLTNKISNLIESFTGILSSRIYIYMEDVPAKYWGYNGSTFD